VGVLGQFQPPSPEALRARLGISEEAAQLFHQSDVIDLHIESYSFYRSFGYDPRRRHTGGLQRGLVVGQADLPRLLETGINGATWVISANPLRPAEDRVAAFREQMRELTELLESADGRVQVVRNEPEYRQAVREGKHACFLGIQGANALPPDPDSLDAFGADLLRITLLHLTSSAWGHTSTPSPWFSRRRRGLGSIGHAYVERMNELRIGVDLAHMHEAGFWDAVGTSDPKVPLLVTHTGVRGAHDHWRNLSDAQLKAIANTGGTVGIMYHSAYLGDGLFSGKLSSVVRHIRHALKVMGPDHVSLGSDWDGAICTPRDMPTCSELPLLVEALLKDGVPPSTIVKILGENFLRVVRALKGTP
jgi:membrane dipeptidase